MIQYLRMELTGWDQVPREQLNPSLARQAIHGRGMTVARIYLAKGTTVPEHSHENEQFSMLESGRLLFRVNGEERVVEPGGVVMLAPGEPHQVTALEDSVAVDLFSPVREDWRSGDDAYLRK